MALYLKLKPRSPPLLFLRPFSSSNSNSNSNSPTSYSSFFSEIKERLKSSPPSSPPPSSSSPPPNSSSAPSFQEIRKHVSEFRSKSAPNLSLSQLLKNKNNENPASSPPSFEAIKESVRRINKSPVSPSLKSSAIGGARLPESVFGPEMRQKAQAGEGKEPAKVRHMKEYSFDELGKKLRSVGPQAAREDGDLLDELSEKVKKIVELDEKEMESKMGGYAPEIRDLLSGLNQSSSKVDSKNTLRRLSVISGLTMQVMPPYMQRPPQEELLERYFHPDHLSSEEKMKAVLEKVRDEFKMHENDCGSARVQVAQLTTKIKHLASALHKKDKHSRKGLQDMVQRRKKLLKYLRRTDWDSYCLVLSRLGLRDVPEYKAPDYKKASDSKTKKASNSKTKKKIKA